MSEVSSVPVLRGDLDSAAPVWVGDPFQATEKQLLKIGKNCACMLQRVVGRFSFKAIRWVFTLQRDSLQTTRNKCYPKLQQCFHTHICYSPQSSWNCVIISLPKLVGCLREGRLFLLQIGFPRHCLWDGLQWTVCQLMKVLGTNPRRREGLEADEGRGSTQHWSCPTSLGALGLEWPLRGVLSWLRWPVLHSLALTSHWRGAAEVRPCARLLCSDTACEGVDS